MTTDDICCDHSDQIMNRLDRAIELLEDLHQARKPRPEDIEIELCPPEMRRTASTLGRNKHEQLQFDPA